MVTEAEEGDWFGWALAAGDFDGDGADDLTIGAPLENHSGATSAGVAHVLYGTMPDGLTANRTQLLFQGASLPIPTATEPNPADQPDIVALTAYPNPFADQASLAFTLAEAGPVHLTVYDALGRRVAVLVKGEHPAGTHTVAFSAEALPAGTYLVRLEAGDIIHTQHLTRLR